MTELEASRDRLDKAGVMVAVRPDGKCKIVRKAEALTLYGCDIYSPAEMLAYVQLEPDRRALMRKLKGVGRRYA